ncbi:MAG: hypothetical protein IJ858_08005, partial [Acidaminococcaceae bacterium]|nr:hypothetical protein [Acidaminococcaceae bacterium]
MEGEADDFWTTSFYEADENGKETTTPLTQMKADGKEVSVLDGNSNPVSNGNNGGIAIGSYSHTEGTRALAVGRVASAYGTNSTAIGLRSSAYGEGSMAFGHGVVAGDETNPYAAQTPLLHEYPESPYDLDGASMLLVDKDGKPILDENGKTQNIEVNPNNVIGAIAMGSYAKATARGSLSVGRYSKAQSAYSTAMGIRAKVGENAKNAIAIGREVTVGEVLEEGEEASGMVADNSIAIGKQSTVLGQDSIAIGTGHTVKGNNSGAFGDPNVVVGDSSYILGNSSEIGSVGTAATEAAPATEDIAVKNAFIIGNGSKIASADAEGGLIYGSNAEVTQENGLALGNETSVITADSAALGSYAKADTVGGYETAAENDVKIGDLIYSSSQFAGTGENVIGTVSVGDAGKERTITNVAAGRILADSTDAINGSQLYAAYDQLQWKVGIDNDGGTNNEGALPQSVVGKPDADTYKSNVRFIAGKGIDISRAVIENGYG